MRKQIRILAAVVTLGLCLTACSGRSLLSSKPSAKTVAYAEISNYVDKDERVAFEGYVVYPVNTLFPCLPTKDQKIRCLMGTVSNISQSADFTGIVPMDVQKIFIENGTANNQIERTDRPLELKIHTDDGSVLGIRDKVRLIGKVIQRPNYPGECMIYVEAIEKL